MKPSGDSKPVLEKKPSNYGGPGFERKPSGDSEPIIEMKPSASEGTELK